MCECSDGVKEPGSCVSGTAEGGGPGGGVVRESNIFSEKGQKMLLGLELVPREKRLEALLKTYRHLKTRIGESTAFLEKLYEESREAQLIRTIPGFGKYLAVLVAVEIADINRFTDATHLHAYAGVIPSIHSSGDRTRYGTIVRAGNGWLRWTAEEAVWQGSGRIMIFVVFLNGWPAEKVLSKRKWPGPGGC